MTAAFPATVGRIIDVSTSIEIERSADDVFAFVSEFPNNPRWQRGQVSCTWTSEPPLRVGSTYDQHARFLGTERAEGEPGRFFGLVSPLLRRLVERSIRRDFPVLKALLEGERATSPGSR